MDAKCIFIGSLENSQRIERGLEFIDVITYRDPCRLVSLPDRPNMDCYRSGCHSPIFAMKAYMNVYNSLCVGMSNCIAKENDQNGCNMHFYRFALKFKIKRKRFGNN